MRITRHAVARSAAALLVATLLAGCEWTVPITDKPTRKVDDRLLGDWSSDSDESLLQVRKYDDWNYVIVLDDGVIRVHHSDVRGTAFVSARQMAPDDTRFMYFAWALSSDGEILTVRSVSEDRVPYQTKTAAEVQKLLVRFRDEPDLFDEDSVRYTRAR